MSAVVSEKEIQEEKTEVNAVQFNIRQFLSEVKTEFLKISWPSKDQVTREFFSVILLVAILTGTILIIDKIFEFVADFFSGRLF